MRFHARREPEETARPRCRRSMSLSLSLSVRWISLSRFNERSPLGIPLARPLVNFTLGDEETNAGANPSLP